MAYSGIVFRAMVIEIDLWRTSEYDRYV